MYEVGFSNLSYFAKCFKAEFGLRPKEFQQKESKHNFDIPENLNHSHPWKQGVVFSAHGKPWMVLTVSKKEIPFFEKFYRLVIVIKVETWENNVA